MFPKLQCLDTNCFHILGSTKTSNNIGFSASPLNEVKPNKRLAEQKVLEISIEGAKRYVRVYRQRYDRRSDIDHKPALSQHSFVKNSNRRSTRDYGRIENKRDVEAKFQRVHGNGWGKKAHARCLTKWASYGGCIPLILQALETIKDLDDAFRPWEENLSNKERSIILKEQSSWERASEIFQWFKRKGCYELNVIHYNIMFRILGKAQKWSLVESLWDEMNTNGIEPINSTYGTLIDACTKGGLMVKALYWIELMKEQDMEPDEVTMGIVVHMYKKAGEFKKAENFFKKWWSSGKSLRDGGRTASTTISEEKVSHGHVTLSSYTYNTLIDTYGKASQVHEASEIFSGMLREGIAPNTVTFNTMIHMYGNHGRLEEMTSLIEKMEELQCPFDTRTYNILISVHAKHNNIKMAADYFTKMKEAHLDPDPVSYRTLLYAFSIRHLVGNAEDLISEMDERGIKVDEFSQSALTRMYIEVGMLEKSWLWFNRFHLEGDMSSECYSANIDAFGERGYFLEAEKAFICCQEKKNLSVLEFNVMIKAYGVGNRYDKACQLFDSMENHGVHPDKCGYSSLIQMLASANLPHIATHYVSNMQEAGLVSDCIPYCAVISSYAKLDQLEMAEELYRTMIKYDVQPDVIVYGVLINAFADAGSVKKAISYVDEMRNSGLPMNEVIYKTLIKLYTKIGYLKEAQETYNLLLSSEEGPDVYCSNCMIDLFSERLMVKQAEEVFESLKRRGIANEFSFAMMLCMYKRIGWFKEAIQIAQNMREIGILTDLLSYNNVLGLYALDGRFKEAVETFKEMMNATIQPDDYTFRSLGIILMKCGVSKQAVGKLEVMRKKDADGGLLAWMSTLSSMVGIDNDDAWASLHHQFLE